MKVKESHVGGSFLCNQYVPEHISMDKIFVKDSYFSSFMENHYLEETKDFNIRVNGNF